MRRGPLARVLWPVSVLYGLVWHLRSVLYHLGWLRSHRLAVPVVVVGNVVVGGAGKTPTVIALVQHLQARGLRPGVVSRGYGRQGSGVVSVNAQTSSALSGDEPLLIARHTGVPVFVGPKRVDAAQTLLAQHPTVDILVSDDGMQHCALQRDITLVVFDARGVGNGWLLPAGLLREPWPAKPWGAGPMLVLHYQGVDPPHKSTAPNTPQLPIFQGRKQLATVAMDAHGNTHPLPQSPARVGALAGIAQPHTFFSMLQHHGLVLDCTLPLPDHASAAALAQALSAAQQQHPHITHWLCTEKDAVKLWDTPLPAGLAAPWSVALLADVPTALWQTLDPMLDAVLKAKRTPLD